MRTAKLLYATTHMVLTDIMLRGRSWIQRKACCLLLYKLILPFIQSMETGQDISGRFQIGHWLWSTRESAGVLEISILSSSGWCLQILKNQAIYTWFMHCTMCKLYFILRWKTICKHKILVIEYHELASTGNYMHNCISLCNALYSASVFSCESH